MKIIDNDIIMIDTQDIVKKIKDSGRYDEIMTILHVITMIQDHDLPVDCYGDENGKAIYRVSGVELRFEAQKMMMILSPDTKFVELDKDKDTFEALERYLRTHNNIFLHNYANSISHKHHPEYDIENVRAALILESLVSNLGQDMESWYVPKGWIKE